MAEPIEMHFGLRTRVGPEKHVFDGFQIPLSEGQFWGQEKTIVCTGTFRCELCKNGRTDRFVVWIVDSGGPKEAQVQSYSPGGANVPTWKGTLTLPGDFDCTVSSAAAMLSYVKLL